MSKSQEDLDSIIKRFEMMMNLQRDAMKEYQEDAKNREDELKAEMSKYMTALQESENDLVTERERNRLLSIHINMLDDRVTKLMESLNFSVASVDKLRKEHEEELLALQKECAQLRQANANLVAQVHGMPVALKRQYETGHAEGFAKGCRESDRYYATGGKGPDNSNQSISNR